MRLTSLLVAAVLAGCGGSAPPVAGVTSTPAPRTATVALNWYPEPEFGGLYEADAAGLYAEKGLAVTIQTGGAGAPVIPQVATGRVEFGISTADEVVLARSQGADIVAVFATYQTHPSCVMVHASRGLKDLSELKGGTLALEDGIPFAQWLYKTYAFDGVTRVPYGGGVTQFLLDPMYAQQGYVTSEPILAEKQGGDPVCFLVADTGYNPYANVVITSGDLIRKDPDLVRDFVVASAKGWDAYLADGTRGNAKIHELNATLEADVLGRMWAAQIPLIRDADGDVGRMDHARWETLEQQLRDVGALTVDSPPVDALFTNRFVDGEKP